jgi:tetraacyldisaccharide 4'-kinase
MRPPLFWSAPRPGFLAWTLAPIGAVYGAVGRARMRRAGYHASVPVLCVGNAGLGGAGKTPIALDIAARLVAMGRSPHFLTRGYGGRLKGPVRVDPESHAARDVGDEPLLLARRAPTWISVDRSAGARAAEAAGAGCLVMDDGMQNPTLHKDVTLLVVDAAVGFGNGFVTPAGPLRETPSDALARATAVVLVGEGAVDDRIARSGLPVWRARPLVERPAGLAPGQRCVAFCGIGRPEKFFEAARSLEVEIVSEIGFPDHHLFTRRDIEELTTLARRHDAILLTTEKDSVRLDSAAWPADVARPIAPPLSIAWEDPDGLELLLRDMFR